MYSMFTIQCYTFLVFFDSVTTIIGLGRLIFEVPRSHTIVHHTRSNSSERVVSSPQWPLPTQHTQNTTNIHAHSGIRTRDPSNLVAAELCLRPQDRRDRKHLILTAVNYKSQFQWPLRLRRRSAAVRLLGLWVRMPPGAWMCVSFECRVLSGKGLCVGLRSLTECSVSEYERKT